MLKHDIVVIGASAGGLDAFKALLAQIPSNFPAAIFIVWHISPNYPSFLPDILSRVCALPVAHARDGEQIQAGRVYVAPPDHHLVLDVEADGVGHVRVTHGPKENMSRPSIDVLFRSAARAYGSRVIGVLLSGMLDDGTSGLHAIKERGGQALVQDPLEATYPNMPINAMKSVAVDYCVSVAHIGELLVQLVKQPLANQRLEQGGDSSVSPQIDAEVRIALEDNSLRLGALKFGEPTVFTCPECHGALLRIKEGNLLRFRCHTGHAYSFEALMAGVSRSVEESLWAALRVMQEHELLLTHLESHLRETGQTEAADLTAQKVRDINQRCQMVKQVVLTSEVNDTETLGVSAPIDMGEPASALETPA